MCFSAMLGGCYLFYESCYLERERLGCREKQKAAKKLLKNGGFQVLLLQETKIENIKPRLLRWVLGNSSFEGEFVKLVGRSEAFGKWDP